MSRNVWKIISIISIISLLAGGLSWYWWTPKREMTKLMQDVAAVVQLEFKEKLPRVRSINRMLIIIQGRTQRDEEVQFREQLLETVQKSDKYKLITWDEIEDKLNQKQWTRILGELGLVPGDAPQSLDAAKKAMKQLDRANFEIDGVLFIEITEFNEGDDADGFGAEIGVQGVVWDRSKAAEVAKVPLVREAIDSRWDLRYLNHAMGNQSLLWRFPLWLIVACGLPWGLIQVVRMVVKRRSNPANMILLASLTLVDAALAWPLLMAFGSGGMAAFFLILVAVGMAFYNYDAIDYIERRLL